MNCSWIDVAETDKAILRNPTIPPIEWQWEKASYLAQWHEPIFELMSKYITPASVVLEVGAGGSHTVGAMAGRLSCRTFGIEPDPSGIMKTLELASSESAAVQMIRGDGFFLPFADSTFDVVYSLGLIEHFAKVDMEKLVLEHRRVCKEGGTVILAVPNVMNLPHTLRKWTLGRRYQFFPEKSYTPYALRRLVVRCGLTVEKLDGVQPLWGLAMISGAWRLICVLDKLGLSKWLNNLKSSTARAILGYMTYVIATK